MKEFITRMNRTLFELETGILIFGCVCQMFVVFVTDKTGYSIGLWIGIATAVFSAYHMWRSLDIGLELGEKSAVGYLSRQNIIRYVVVAAVLIATAATNAGNPLTAFLGVMGLKAAAYMQPFTKKISKLLYGEEMLPDLIEEPDCEQEIRR